VALFYDPANSYTQSLANAFRTQFTADGKQIVATEQYTVNKPSNFTQLLNDAESHNPDLIYFAGYASDASVLLTDLPTSGPFANLQIMGGDALYELGGYTSSASGARVRLHFTTFAYPDEWQILCSSGKSFACTPPSFFADYKADYNPNNQHTTGNPYGYTRTDADVMLSYDATLVMLTASGNALTGKKTLITPNDLLQALKQINGAQAIQGVSGQIAFGSDGNPINKAIVTLKVVNGGFFVEDSVQGCFQKGTC
jgi:eukaryotic-like serine/threonine-protein kinase